MHKRERLEISCKMVHNTGPKTRDIFHSFRPHNARCTPKSPRNKQGIYIYDSHRPLFRGASGCEGGIISWRSLVHCPFSQQVVACWYLSVVSVCSQWSVGCCLQLVVSCYWAHKPTNQPPLSTLLESQFSSKIWCKQRGLKSSKCFPSVVRFGLPKCSRIDDMCIKIPCFSWQCQRAL